MKSIICATDYSINSVPALKMAFALSQKIHCQLVVLHVFDMGLNFANPLSLSYAKKEKEAIAKHKKDLRRFCQSHLDMEHTYADVKFVVKKHALVKHGILDAIKEQDSFLLVMGHKGKGALTEAFFGSTTKDMIVECACPVLAVPSNWEKVGVNSILYATDFEETDIESIDWLVKFFAEPFDSNVNVFHVSIADEYSGEDQMQWFQEMLAQKVSYKKIDFATTRSEDVFGTLLNEVDKTNVDVLVMLEREKEGFFSALVQGDKVNQMVSHGSVPLLSFNKNRFR